MARNEPQINLRIPAELKDALEGSAVQSKRSVTAEIVARLEASFQGVAGKDAKALAEQISVMSERIQQYEEAYGLSMVTQGFLAQAVIDAYSKNEPADLTPAQKRVVALAKASVERRTNPRGFAERFLDFFGEVQVEEQVKTSSRARPNPHAKTRR